jgi:type VI secretion system protein ImpL
VPSGNLFWLTGGLLTALGLTILSVYVLIARVIAREPRPDTAPEAGEAGAAPDTLSPVRDLIAEADRRLASAPNLAGKGRGGLHDLPMYILAGAPGAGKTSTFLAAGLSPELLAGQVHRESTILPTGLCNFWYANDAIFVETGGRFCSDDSAHWRSLVEQLAGRASALLDRFRPRRRPKVRGLIWFCEITPFLNIPDPTRISTLSRKVQEDAGAR